MLFIKMMASLLMLLLFTVSPTVYSQQSITKLSILDCKKLHQLKVITSNNPVLCSRLSKVRFSYENTQGIRKNDGQLVVLDVIAPLVVKLTAALANKGFMIAKAHPMEHYLGDDKRSMDDNNTSAFNGRAMTNGTRWSLHAYGVAIDINPVQNPFIDIAKDGTAVVSPVQSARYAMNRLNDRVGKQPRRGMAEEVVNLFAQHGFFIWGGDWNYPIDYQHFQVGPRRFIERLIALPLPQAQALLEQQINGYHRCLQANVTKRVLQRRAYCAEVIISHMKK